MISALQAEHIISRHIKSIKPVFAPLTEANGRTLQENLKTDRNFPPFDKALMDGIAINIQSYKKGNRIFLIEGDQPPGQPPKKLKSKNNCFEIMTGAALPRGCNCLIPVEKIKIVRQKAHLPDGLKLDTIQYIRKKGSDHKKNSLVLKKGCRLSPAHIAIAASIGKKTICVNSKLNVAVIATGDELVDLDKKIGPFQTRLSNSYALDAAFSQTGLLNIRKFHLRDNKQNMLKNVRKILQDFDILVFTGGVSMGKFDYVPQVLKELGVQTLFHKISQRPGRPFWFGKNKTGKLVFALPGNPISTLVCAYRYVIPALKTSLGLDLDIQKGILSKTLSNKSGLTLFIPARVKINANGTHILIPVSVANSGDLASLGESNGFLELPANTKHFSKNTAVSFYSWRD